MAPKRQSREKVKPPSTEVSKNGVSRKLYSGLAASIVLLAISLGYFCNLRESASADLLLQRKLSDDWELPGELRTMLVCNLFCVRNTTSKHEMLATLIKQRREAAGEKITEEWPVFVEDACIERCLLDYNKGTMQLGEKFQTARELPTDIAEYLSCSKSCTTDLLALAKGGMKSSAMVIDILRRCGVVHVPLGSEYGHIINDLVKGYEAVKHGSIDPGLSGFIDSKQPPLRSGRQEIWLPHELPFTLFKKLIASNIVSSLAVDFFNSTNIFVDHVNIVNAPGGGTSLRQDLHSDVGKPKEHLEVHVPLLPVVGAVPLTMGPTRFCPCTQDRVDLRDPYQRTIRRYFGGASHCLEFEDLSWTLHDRNTEMHESFWITLYDADVFHQGLENVASKDRPVLVIALTRSHATALERNYVKRNVSQAMANALVGFREEDLSPILVQNTG